VDAKNLVSDFRSSVDNRFDDRIQARDIAAAGENANALRGHDNPSEQKYPFQLRETSVRLLSYGGHGYWLAQGCAVLRLPSQPKELYNCTNVNRSLSSAWTSVSFAENAFESLTSTSR
jgi:hypothetical protein